MGITNDNRVFILDVIRVQLDSYARERLIRSAAKRDGRHVIVGFEQEGGSGGLESVENSIRRLPGWRCRVIKPGRGQDKEARADPFSTQVNGGSVYMVKAGWNADYIDELKYFPLSTYKDQVDASAGCFTCLIKGNRRVGGMKRRHELLKRFKKAA